MSHVCASMRGRERLQRYVYILGIFFSVYLALVSLAAAQSVSSEAAIDETFFSSFFATGFGIFLAAFAFLVFLAALWVYVQERHALRRVFKQEELGEEPSYDAIVEADRRKKQQAQYLQEKKAKQRAMDVDAEAQRRHKEQTRRRRQVQMKRMHAEKKMVLEQQKQEARQRRRQQLKKRGRVRAQKEKERLEKLARRRQLMKTSFGTRKIPRKSQR